MGNKHSAVVQFQTFKDAISKRKKQRDDSKKEDTQSSDEYLHECSQGDYVIEEPIGSGSFGEVYRCRQQDGDVNLAVKIMEQDVHVEKDWPCSSQSMFLQEVEILSSIEHENIIRFWQSWEDETHLYVVTEFCAGGDLFEKLLKQKSFAFVESESAALAVQMLSAIAFLHDHMIMHRDIKAENFLLTGDFITSTVKLIDFGTATRFQAGEIFTFICGSENYLSPEVLQMKYNHMTDMWALGVLIYLLIFGRYPFEFSSIKELKTKIAGPIDWTPRAKLDLMPATLDFMKALLQQDPGERACSKQAQKHAFIQVPQWTAEPGFESGMSSACASLADFIEENQETGSPVAGAWTESGCQDYRDLKVADMRSGDRVTSTAKAGSKSNRLGAFTVTAVSGIAERFRKAREQRSGAPAPSTFETSASGIKQVLPCAIPGSVE
mmetsp:Transcript_78703/g.138842  ORF Transcript_78703/g.138842 Transcript_78703/m.138842 type:complete len:437 (-) Transcript_78703:73-1383(-)